LFNKQNSTVSVIKAVTPTPIKAKMSGFLTISQVKTIEKAPEGCNAFLSVFVLVAVAAQVARAEHALRDAWILQAARVPRLKPRRNCYRPLHRPVVLLCFFYKSWLSPNKLKEIIKNTIIVCSSKGILITPATFGSIG